MVRRFVERLMLPAIAFAEKDAQEQGVFRKLHNECLTMNQNQGEAATEPDGDQTANKRKNAVQSRFQPIPVARELESLQTKRRKRGVNAEPIMRLRVNFNTSTNCSRKRSTPWPMPLRHRHFSGTFGRYHQFGAKVTHDYVLRIREAYAAHHGRVGDPPRRTTSGAVWAAGVNLMFSSIALSELTAERMRSYGALSPGGSGDYA